MYSPAAGGSMGLCRNRMMKPEQLKKLAEALGYEVAIYPGGVTITGNHPFGTRRHFDPSYNPAQREEVLLWLLGRGWDLQCRDSGGEVCFIAIKNYPGSVTSHKDYTTALMMACEKELDNA